MSSRRKTPPNSFSTTAPGRPWLSELSARPRLLNLTDLLIGLLLLLLPFVMGGREAWGHWLLISLSFLLGTVWYLHRVLKVAVCDCWPWNRCCWQVCCWSGCRLATCLQMCCRVCHPDISD